MVGCNIVFVFGFESSKLVDFLYMIAQNIHQFLLLMLIPIPENHGNTISSASSGSDCYIRSVGRSVGQTQTRLYLYVTKFGWQSNRNSLW